jgi:hypothetical protein
MRRLLLLVVLLQGLLASGPALAQSVAPAAPGQGAPSPEQLQSLADLLRDPDIQSWLQAQASGKAVAATAAIATTGPTSMHQAMAGWLDGMRAFLHELTATLPLLPAELGRTWTTLAMERQDLGAPRVLILLAVFAALGFGLEWLFWWATTGFRTRMIGASLDSAPERLRAVGQRAGYGIGVLLAFALGSVGAFLAFEWPPLHREIVLAYLMVFLIIRLVLVLGRILLAPAAERFRVIPMANASARFWFVWSAILVGWFFFVNLTLDLLELLGASVPAVYLVGLACGVVLVGLVLYVVWRHPERQSGAVPARIHRLGTWTH